MSGKDKLPLPDPLHFNVPNARAKIEPDTRMVKCVLRGYTDCPAIIPAACICGGMPYYMYDELYQRKYGNDADH